MLKIFKEEQPCLLSGPRRRILPFNPQQSVREEPGGFMWGAEGCETVNNRVKEGGQAEREVLGGAGRFWEVAEEKR